MRVALSVLLLFTLACSLAQPVFARTADDTLFADQWYLQTISAPAAWDKTTGSADVVVALLDTGFDETHPDLTGNTWTNSGEIPANNIDDDSNGFIDDVHGYDFVNHDADPQPDIGQPYDEGAVSHASVVAGIVGAIGNNATGMAGINWQVRMMNVRILDNEGLGSSYAAREGVDYAVANGAKIINMSFTGFEYDADLEASIKRAYDAGVVIVAAVGNTKDGGIDIDTKPIYPVCFGTQDVQDWVLGVAAINQRGERAFFSNYGTCTDISAPGEDIVSAVYQNDAWQPFKQGYYQEGWSGTSMAAPMVAGAAALLKAYRPTLTPKEIRTVLRLSVDPLVVTGAAKGKMGAGRLNIAAAMKLAEQLSPPSASSGTLIKTPCTSSALADDPCKAVYFYGEDQKRHAFPNERVFFSWFTDFSSIKEVTAATMSAIPLGKNVTYHPGIKMVKFQTVSTVYAVDRKGVLRPISSEAVAAALYGDTWNKQIDDIADVFLSNYTFGAAIQSPNDFSVTAAKLSVSGLHENF